MFPSITCMSIACNYPVLCHIKITPLSFMDILYILYVFYFIIVFILCILYIFYMHFLCNNYIYYLYFCQKEVRTLSFQPLTLCITIFSQTADKKTIFFFYFSIITFSSACTSTATPSGTQWSSASFLLPCSPQKGSYRFRLSGISPSLSSTSSSWSGKVLLPESAELSRKPGIQLPAFYEFLPYILHTK